MRKILSLWVIWMMFAATDVSAQQVTARIAGLEENTDYMEMLRQEAQLQAREDSVTTVVNRYRQMLVDDPSQQTRYSSEILRCEELLFDIRTERGRLTDRINTVEQEWVLANLDFDRPASAEPVSAESRAVPDSLQVADLVHNSYFKEQLPATDYHALLMAQRREHRALELARACMENYGQIEELKIAYDTVTVDSTASELYARYQTLELLNRNLCDSLQRLWSRIYDNKSYAYAYVLDRLGRDDLLEESEKQAAALRQRMASERGNYYADELTDYLLQKRSMLDGEERLAGVLGLTAARDSLVRVAASMRNIDYRLPKILIEERLFLDYAPIGFVSPAKYNASHPIPEVKLYDRGTIYRIQLATYTNRTNGGYLFKGAYPIGYEKIDGRYAYYAGGFRTLEEAQEAQREMKRRGFKRPEIIVWNDGVRTNLADAAEEGHAPMFRVEIGGAEELSEEVRTTIRDVAGECEISRIGHHFNVGPLTDKALADSLAERLLRLDPALEIKVAAIVE